MAESKRTDVSETSGGSLSVLASMLIAGACAAAFGCSAPHGFHYNLSSLVARLKFGSSSPLNPPLAFSVFDESCFKYDWEGTSSEANAT